MDSEYRILSILHNIGFPVPRPLHYCPDASIIGTDFYVMEFVCGRVFRDDSLLDLPPGERQGIISSTLETLAQLHSVDWKRLGLKSRSEKGGYCQRQVSHLHTHTA